MLLDLLNQSIGTAGAGGSGCPRACPALPCPCLSLHCAYHIPAQGAQWQRVGGGRRLEANLKLQPFQKGSLVLSSWNFCRRRSWGKLLIPHQSLQYRLPFQTCQLFPWLSRVPGTTLLGSIKANCAKVREKSQTHMASAQLGGSPASATFCLHTPGPYSTRGGRWHQD